METTQKFVIKVENGQAINNPLLYSNFLLLYPCPRQEIPTNDVIGPYGYEVFTPTPPTKPNRFEHPAKIERYEKIDGIWTQIWKCDPFTPEEVQKETEAQWERLRNIRNYLLRQTDWTQLNDAPTDQLQQVSWILYRQKLRDITKVVTDPFDVEWPTPPADITPKIDTSKFLAPLTKTNG